MKLINGSYRHFYVTAMLLLSAHGYCWNALGHQLVGQIAYDNLSDHAREVFSRLNHKMDTVYKPQSLVEAAAWMDTLSYKNERWLQYMHYIDIPYSVDGSRLMEPDKKNAVSAIKKAKEVLLSKDENAFNKAFSLRILLHVTGDIHQPMHAVSQFSTVYPAGDLGGNLFPLAKNPIGKNLHAYWDKGGGLLTGSHRYSSRQIRSKALRIEKRFPCEASYQTQDPLKWSQESYRIAVTKAYAIKKGSKPGEKYQRMVKKISEQRIAMAGCRLAFLLNDLAGNRKVAVNIP